MLLKQLSIFLENKPGKLGEITEFLKDNNVNIRALSMADTADFGILRLIVPEVDRVYQILKDNNVTVRITDVVGVKVPDTPGGLNKIIHLLSEQNINVEYMYAFVSKKEDNAFIIFKVENVNRAIEILVKENIELVSGQEVYEI